MSCREASGAGRAYYLFHDITAVFIFRVQAEDSEQISHARVIRIKTNKETDAYCAEA